MRVLKKLEPVRTALDIHVDEKGDGGRLGGRRVYLKKSMVGEVELERGGE